jgi:hypothetical protein
MSTMTTSTLPRPAAETTAAYAARGRRQTVAVLIVATLFGVWLGTSAPAVSPVSTPPAPAAADTAVPIPAVPDLAPADPRGPRGAGRPR